MVIRFDHSLIRRMVSCARVRKILTIFPKQCFLVESDSGVQPPFECIPTVSYLMLQEHRYAEMPKQRMWKSLALVNS